MRRRDLLTAAGASLAAPRIGRAERRNKLVFVPTEDLGVLDPAVTGIRSTRNHAYLVFDTLYGIDTSRTAQPQMVEGHQVEEEEHISGARAAYERFALYQPRNPIQPH